MEKRPADKGRTNDRAVNAKTSWDTPEHLVSASEEPVKENWYLYNMVKTMRTELRRVDTQGREILDMIKEGVDIPRVDQ